MKKIKTNKLSLNKQTVSNLGNVKGGLFRPYSDSKLGAGQATCKPNNTCGGSCVYTCNQSDACETGNSNCYCG